MLRILYNPIFAHRGWTIKGFPSWLAINVCNFSIVTRGSASQCGANVEKPRTI